MLFASQEQVLICNRRRRVDRLIDFVRCHDLELGRIL